MITTSREQAVIIDYHRWLVLPLGNDYVFKKPEIVAKNS
jgi:hypothetical protein